MHKYLYLLLAGAAFCFLTPTKVKCSANIPIVEYTRAIDQASKATRHKMYQYRARAYAQKGMWPEALEDISYSITLQPTVPAYRQRAEILIKMQRCQEAVSDLDIILNANPNDFKSYQLRSKANFEEGLFGQALKDAEKGLQLRPTDPVCREIKHKSLTRLNPDKKIIIKPSYVPRYAGRSPTRNVTGRPVRQRTVYRTKTVRKS